jgi:hypothetical protein
MKGRPLRVSFERERKGQLKMRALVDEIGRFAERCTTIKGAVAPGPSVEFGHIDAVVNALDCALVAIRTLDKEIYHASNPDEYTKLRNNSGLGEVVRALTGPRNSAVHHVDVIDPDIARAIGPLDGDRFIIFPKWKQRVELPPQMFQYNGKDVATLIQSYDNAAAGRLVLETLMDAFSFFDQCDPTLADRDAQGRLVGFPLPPPPVAGYQRLSPDWPDHSEVDRRIRVDVRAKPPGGLGREITGRLRSDLGWIYCGYSMVDEYRRQAFTEDADQIARDVGLGYKYTIRVEGGLLQVDVRDGELFAENSLLDDADVPDLTNESPWPGWWAWCQDDAYYYRSQRQSR